MGVESLIALQQLGKYKGIQALEDFAKQMRLREAMADLATTPRNVTTPEGLGSFAKEHRLNPTESGAMLKLMATQKAINKPDDRYSASALGVLDEYTGKLTDKPQLTKDFKIGKMHKLGKDGSVVEVQPSTESQYLSFLNDGFSVGDYTPAPGAGNKTQPQNLIVWQNEDEPGKTYSLPPGVDPKEKYGGDNWIQLGKKSDSKSIEERMMMSMEFQSRRDDVRAAKAAVDRLQLAANLSEDSPLRQQYDIAVAQYEEAKKARQQWLDENKVADPTNPLDLKRN